jgi:hypothetical protein
MAAGEQGNEQIYPQLRKACRPARIDLQGDEMDHEFVVTLDYAF